MTAMGIFIIQVIVDFTAINPWSTYLKYSMINHIFLLEIDVNYDFTTNINSLAVHKGKIS